MKAARVHRFGPPDVISIDEIDVPSPGNEEVLVKVKFAGVGPWDAWIRAGKSVLDQPLPLTLGSDLSGTVVALGAEASRFGKLEVGMEVFGVANARFTDAYAEYAIAKAAGIAPKAAAVPWADAAAAPVVAVTALQMLRDHGKVAPGKRVLVLGAGGAVGSWAVQLGRIEGAHVIGTEVARAIDSVKALGVAEVIDATTERYEDVIAPVDLVIDTVGGPSQERAMAVLKPGGVLVSSVSKPSEAEATRRQVRAFFMLVDVKREPLSRIGELLGTGKVSATRLGPRFPLTEARKVHEMLDGLVPRQPGKMLLEIG